MIENGRNIAAGHQIVWTSDDVPNDATALRAGLDPVMAKKIQEIPAAITELQPKAILPKHYVGLIA
jgi:phosphonate transport system substrate-binding protein